MSENALKIQQKVNKFITYQFSNKFFNLEWKEINSYGASTLCRTNISNLLVNITMSNILNPESFFPHKQQFKVYTVKARA